MGQQLTRRDDWLARLSAAIAAAEGRPFAWGKHDCCTFAAACVEAMIGRHPFPDMQGAYRTRREADAFLRKHGGLDALVDGLFAPCPPLLARRGDLATLPTARGPALGVVDTYGQHVIAAAQKGVLHQPLHAALKAWRVG